MTEETWKPLSRLPVSTVTKVLRSHAFRHSREHSATIVESSAELRALADRVEALDHTGAPLGVVADRVVAAVAFLRARADELDDSVAAARGRPGPTGPSNDATANAGVATRERLLVASLHYLVTPLDLVPDFTAGGYVDDVFLLAWVFGVAGHELAPYLDDAGDGDDVLDPL